MENSSVFEIMTYAARWLMMSFVISNPGMYKKDDIYGLKVFQPKFRHWFEVNWSSHPLNEKKKFVERGKQEISDNRGGLWRVLWVQAQS